MQKLNYALIVIYISLFAFELAVVDPVRAKLIHIDSSVTPFMVGALFLLLIISLKNIKDRAGKIGLIIIAATLLVKVVLDHFGA